MGDTNVEERNAIDTTVPGTFIVTIHGIGAYDTCRGAARTLMGALDESFSAAVRFVDFDWFTSVEAGRTQADKVAQLSASLLESAHLSADEETLAAGFIVRA